MEQVVEEEPVESKIETLETHDLEPSNEEIRTGRAESVTEPSLENCSPEPVVELETPVSELNGQDQTPIENDTKVLETEDSEPSNKAAPSQIAENFIESLQEESIPEPVVETETSVPELNDQDQTFVESEEPPMEIDASEHIKEEISSDTTETIGPLQETGISEAIGGIKAPLAELNDQDFVSVENSGVPAESDLGEPAVNELEGSEDIMPPVKSEEWDSETDSQSRSNESIPAEITESAAEHPEQTPNPAIETEMYVLESSDQDQTPVEDEEKSAEADVSESEITGFESSEEQLPPPVGDKEESVEMTPQDAVQDSVAEDEIPSSRPETSEGVQSIVEDEEIPQLAERQTAEVPTEELAFENQFLFASEDENVVGTAPDGFILEPEIKSENLMNIPESSEEIYYATDNEEKPTSTKEQFIETSSGEPVSAGEPTSEHFINEDPEDIRAREEIAALNAQMARILAEGAEVQNSESIVEETNEPKGNNFPAETEIFPGEEPKELKVERHVKLSTDPPNVQPPVESQEIFEEQLEETVHTDASEVSEEGKKPVTDKQRSSESHPEDNFDKLAAASTNLEEDNSFEEPEIEAAKNTIIPPTDELAQREEITPDTGESTGQAEYAEDEYLQGEKSLGILTGIGENVPKSLLIAEEPKSGANTDEDSSLELEFTSLEERHGLENESVAAGLPAKTETIDHQNADLSDDGGPPANIEEKESLSVQLEPGPVTGGELHVTQFESVPAKFAQDSESKDSEKETVLENSPVQEAIEGGPSSKINMDIEGENEEMEDAIPSVEHLEVIEAEPSPEENLKDVGAVGDAESEIVNEHLNNAKELETEEITLESASDWVDISKTVKDNSVEDRAQELDDLAELQSPESSHEEISGPNSGIQHDNEPSRDEIASEISSPSNPVLNESIALDGMDYPVPESLPVQDNIQTEVHQTSEDVLPVESQVAQNSYIVPNENKIESTSESGSIEILVIPENEYIPEEEVLIESKPVLSSHEAIVEENNDHSPRDDTSRGQFESKFLPGSEPQAQPSIENFSDATETPRKEVIPLGEEALFKKEKSMTKPTEDQAFEDNESISGEAPTVLKDDDQLEDITSFYSRDDEPERATETYRQEGEFPSHEGSFGPGAFTTDYIDTEQLERVLEPENIQIDSRQSPTQQSHFSSPGPVPEQRYSSYEETPLDARTFSDYQDDNEALEPEPKPVTSDFDPTDAHLTHGASFSRSVTEQRYSGFEETPSAAQTSFNRQHNSEQSVPELEPQTIYESPPYQQNNLSKPYASQEVQGDDTKAAQDRPITPKDQTKHQDDIPPTPSTSVTNKMSTETFPTYDESRRSPASHGLNFGLPVRTSERAETIRQSPKSENERPYPTHNEPIRPSGPSRLPIASQKSTDTIRKNPELKKQLSYSRYDEPPTPFRSSQGSNIGLPTRIPGSVEKPRENSEFESQAGFPQRDEPIRFSGHSQGSKFGLSTPNPAAVESQWEIAEPVNRSSNVRSLLRQFEGGESSSSTNHQERFITSLPRPAGNKSFGKEIGSEEKE
ncbi:hypothetical protein OCU04_012230 [Sclerotinia nivalis]|uniref:Uncharacterized protein n=1 Tax=Sclerotinia nivalis TaxID=352851 RepID=A0A9X0DE75_9HELO|nr:hypothetical protein OCU04_012230 [Sclerotinia nivalis]